MASRLAFLALFIVLLAVNWSIAGKQRLLSEGTRMYLELAPRDPRSLLQGDYMALRYRLGNEVRSQLYKSEPGKPWRWREHAQNGYLIVALDDRGVASLRRLDKEQMPLAENELRLLFRVRKGVVKFASNAFFFQEGQAQLYRAARYGEFRVARDGQMLLVALCDKDLQRLGPKPK